MGRILPLRTSDGKTVDRSRSGRASPLFSYDAGVEGMHMARHRREQEAEEQAAAQAEAATAATQVDDDFVDADEELEADEEPD